MVQLFCIWHLLPGNILKFNAFPGFDGTGSPLLALVFTFDR
jgi:hypothetical protein